MPVRSTAAAIASAARSSGRTPARAPRYRPTGVRTASMIRASATGRDDATSPDVAYGGQVGFMFVTLGAIGVIVLLLVLIARAYPGSGADLVDWKPTRSHELEA